MDAQDASIQVLVERVLSDDNNKNWGIFTIESIKTKKNFSYRITTSTYKGHRYVWVYALVAYMKFEKIGFYLRGDIYVSSTRRVDAPNAKGAAWVISKCLSGDINAIKKSANVFCSRKCVVCGKTLTTPKGIMNGIGSICAKKLATKRMLRG